MSSSAPCFETENPSESEAPALLTSTPGVYTEKGTRVEGVNVIPMMSLAYALNSSNHHLNYRVFGAKGTKTNTG